MAKLGFALRDLDTGLFYAKSGWTHVARFAQRFPDADVAEKVASELNIKNAELVFLNREDVYLGGIPIRISK